MSTADSIWWQKNVISYHQILENIGNKHGTNPQLDDLDMFNTETAPDPMELLMEAQLAPIEFIGGISTMPQVAAKKQEEDVKIITPKLAEMLDEMAQRSYTSMVKAGNWVAALMKETDERDYIPDIEETKRGIVMATNGIELYAYNRDFQDTDPTRRGLTSGQWKFLDNMVTQVTEMEVRLDTLEEAGFIPRNSFADEYNAVRADRLDGKKRKHTEALMREQRSKNALNEADEATKERLAKRFA